MLLSVDDGARNAVVFPEQEVNSGIGKRPHSSSFSGGLEKQVVQIFSSHASPANQAAICARKRSFHRSLIEAVPHAPEWRAADNLAQPKSLQNPQARGHQAFAAWLFSGKDVPFKELDRNAAASQQNCER